MLSVRGLESGYGNTVIVRDFNLDLEVSSVNGLLGRNGVGKTTALKTIMGLLPVNKGSITFDGQDITRLSAHQRARSGIAYVPQGRLIFASMSVEDNIRVAAYGAAIEGVDQAIQEMYDYFPILNEKKNQPGGQLSGGQQQMLAIARALVSRPKIILLDEPSEGIQPSIVAQIGDVIRDLCNERHIGFILVEQNFDFAINTVNSVNIMEKGSIVYTSDTDTIKNDTELQRRYLGL